MSNYMIIGDLHGKLELAEEVLASKYKMYHKVFVGDYVDSYTKDVDNQALLLRLILSASDRDDVSALLGNHELSYLEEGMKCGGFNTRMHGYIIQLEKEMREKLLNYMYLDDDILVTHAGANQELFNTKEDIKEALESNAATLYNIGHSRGGQDRYGGVFWNDFWVDHWNIEGLTQIVGHTAHRLGTDALGIVEMDGDWNVDCLDRVKEVLLVTPEEGSFVVHTL